MPTKDGQKSSNIKNIVLGFMALVFVAAVVMSFTKSDEEKSPSLIDDVIEESDNQVTSDTEFESDGSIGSEIRAGYLEGYYESCVEEATDGTGISEEVAYSYCDCVLKTGEAEFGETEFGAIILQAGFGDESQLEKIEPLILACAEQLTGN